jgi:hypothetical protein
VVPGDALENGYTRPTSSAVAAVCGWKRALGDAARNDGRDRRSEGQQEEELDQLIAIFGNQHIGRGEKMSAVSNAVANKEVGDGRYAEVDQDFNQALT